MNTAYSTYPCLTPTSALLCLNCVSLNAHKPWPIQAFQTLFRKHVQTRPGEVLALPPRRLHTCSGMLEAASALYGYRQEYRVCSQLCRWLYASENLVCGCIMGTYWLLLNVIFASLLDRKFCGCDEWWEVPTAMGRRERVRKRRWDTSKRWETESEENKESVRDRKYKGL